MNKAPCFNYFKVCEFYNNKNLLYNIIAYRTSYFCKVKLISQLNIKKMKKTILIVSLITVPFGITLQAQDSGSDTRERLTIGAKIGMNYSNVWDEKGQDFTADSKVGFAGGGFIGIPLGKFLGIQPEILLSQKGVKGGGTVLGIPYTYSRRTTYIDIPLQLQLKPIEYLTLLFGPQYSYLISSKNDYTFGANSTSQEQEFENENIRENILGFVAGADVNISHLVISGRVGWDFQTNNGDGTSSTPRYKNQWIQLTVGLKI